MDRRRRGRESAGLTLIEIMIAVTIMVMALLGLFGVILHTTQSNEVQRENLAAMRAAEDKIEELLTAPFDQILTIYDAPPVNLSQPWKTRIGEPGNRFDVIVNTIGVDPFRLEPVSGSVAVGRISFPTTGGTAGNSLDERETGEFTRMGNEAGDDLDLDGDGNATGTFLTSAAVNILPVRIDLTWMGIRGRTNLTYHHVILKR